MKKKLIIASILLHFIVVLIGMTLLPEQIPAHYNMAGEIDRMGSRLELLLIPCLSALLTSIPLLFPKPMLKRNNPAFLSYLLVGLNLFFLFLSIQFIVDALAYSKVGVDAEFLLGKLSIPASGLLFIILGNYLPKVKNNGLIGLRTSWSMHNDVCWYHSQRLGGITFIVFGILLISICPFLSYNRQLMFFMAGMLVVLVIDMYGSYRIYLKYKDKEDLVK